MTFIKYLCYAIFSAIFCGYIVYAQTNPPIQQGSSKSQPRLEKKQTINFEDELIEGTAQKPEFFYLFQKKNFNYKRLIRLRENFIPEIRRSSEDIQRLRGGR